MNTTIADAATKTATFHGLHVRGRPFVLLNAWDAGSAAAVAAGGAPAIATGSWSVAAAHGYGDGEKLPLDLVIANARRIAHAVTVPVSIDLESGYGADPAAVAATIARVIEAGAIGCNLEDSEPADGSLRDVAVQVARIRAARAAADAALPRFFINLRTDVFFRKGVPHDVAAVELALERARAYADAGADGLFAPGLADAALIGRLAGASPLPLNIMVMPNTPSVDVLARCGVARVSHGPGPYAQAMQALQSQAREVYAVRA
ncbi:MAG: isocitrate lyase/PEP mutase family protein [Dokdonella sp.]|uniref:isocitrate lyase/PEP mutase family protein n=1 Tax=Dokdonella sp. TaxID=2291710 RepID=UPI003F7E062A